MEQLTQDALQDFGDAIITRVKSIVNPQQAGQLDEAIREAVLQEFRYARRYDELTDDAEEIGYQQRRGDSWDTIGMDTLKVQLKSMVGSKNVDKAKQLLITHACLVMPEHFPTRLEYPYQPNPDYRIVIEGGARWGVDPKQGKHPYFDRWAEHLGLTLRDDISKLSIPGIKTGGDYIKAWYANVAQHPYERTPYMYLYGMTKGGKSISGDALLPPLGQNIFTTDTEYLTGTFNGAIAKYVIHIIDEFNASRHSDAANLIKRWSTCRTIRR